MTCFPQRRVDVWQMGKLRHEEVDWCDLTLLGCCRTKKGTQISQTSGCKESVQSKGKHQAFKRIPLLLFLGMVLGAHLPVPDFHNSPKHREPFSSVFTSSMTKRIGQNTPGRKDFQLFLQAAVIASRWRLGTLVFTREAVSKLNETSRGAGRPQQQARRARNLCFCWERIWWGSLLYCRQWS